MTADCTTATIRRTNTVTPITAKVDEHWVGTPDEICGVSEDKLYTKCRALHLSQIHCQIGHWCTSVVETCTQYNLPHSPAARLGILDDWGSSRLEPQDDPGSSACTMLWYIDRTKRTHVISLILSYTCGTMVLPVYYLSPLGHMKIRRAAHLLEFCLLLVEIWLKSLKSDIRKSSIYLHFTIEISWDLKIFFYSD